MQNEKHGKVTIAIAGLGNRGKDAYAPAIHNLAEKCEIVAIADIVPEKVQDVAKRYNIPPERCYDSAEALIAADKMADALVIATQDRQHVGQAIPAMEKGYHILLEKPISPDLDECRQLVEASQRTGRHVVVCHVLRYTPFFREVKRILDAGTIGDIVSIMGIECVGYYHQAHSFVRGNWRRDDETSPMILQKCCHDMDLYMWLANKRCQSVTSFGDTYLFKAEKAPEGAAKRCLDGCGVKETCPFDAEKIYITDKDRGVAHGHTGWPVETLVLEPTVETVRRAIETTPYGRCVYHCDNNVVDHQVVNLNMEDNTTMSFTMTGMTNYNTRYVRFMGTEGELCADLRHNTIDTVRFGEEHQIVDFKERSVDLKGHAGGDEGLIEDFVGLLAGEKQLDGSLTSVDVSMESHYIALAAEKSRKALGALVPLSSMR